jgi:hypothetical protein
MINNNNNTLSRSTYMYNSTCICLDEATEAPRILQIIASIILVNGPRVGQGENVLTATATLKGYLACF